MIEQLEVYLKKVLHHYAEFNVNTLKWEITFDELNEMIQFYLDKYWNDTHYNGGNNGTCKSNSQNG